MRTFFTVSRNFSKGLQIFKIFQAVQVFSWVHTNFQTKIAVCHHIFMFPHKNFPDYKNFPTSNAWMLERFSDSKRTLVNKAFRLRLGPAFKTYTNYQVLWLIPALANSQQGQTMITRCSQLICRLTLLAKMYYFTCLKTNYATAYLQIRFVNNKS